jgi:hypothetical protein
MRLFSKKVLLTVAAVACVLPGVLVLLAMTPTDEPGGMGRTGKVEVVAAMRPGPSAVTLDRTWVLVEAVGRGEQISIVRFQSGREEREREDEQGNRVKVYPLATRLAGVGEPHTIWVGGNFTRLADLHRSFFRKWGQVKDTVEVNASRGPRPGTDYQRLYDLLPAREAEDPVIPQAPVPPRTLLAVVPPSARSAVDGHYIGPLTEYDVRALPEMVALLAKEPFAEMPASRAKELLGSRNAWIAWLGLARLGGDAPQFGFERGPAPRVGLRVLRTEHFARAARSRVPGDAEDVVREMVDAIWKYDTARADHPRHLVRLGTTSGMQEAILRALVKYLKRRLDSSNPSTHPIDLPAVQKAAREYRAEIQDKGTHAAVVRQLDALIALR